jgi:hypothetical protein
VRTAVLLALLAATTVLTGCGGATSPEARSGPHDEAAELRHELLVAERAVTSPGSRIQLFFPEETDRGLGFVLEEEVDDGWALRYFLTSAPTDQGPSGPSWVVADDAEPGWDALAISGPGPDHIEVPDTAADGTYRLCTATAPENYCTQIDVTSH